MYNDEIYTTTPGEDIAAPNDTTNNTNNQYDNNHTTNTEEIEGNLNVEHEQVNIRVTVDSVGDNEDILSDDDEDLFSDEDDEKEEIHVTPGGNDINNGGKQNNIRNMDINLDETDSDEPSLLGNDDEKEEEHVTLGGF